jgi:DNA-binding XRE family transcriptional regulator
MTQAELAEQIGVSRTRLSRIEKGHNSEQLRQAVVILRRLGVRATIQHADW